MAKATPARHGGGIDAVRRRVKTQVHSLRCVAALLLDFTQAHEKYALDQNKLLPASVPASLNAVAWSPALQRLVTTLERLFASVAQAHAALAAELQSAVVAPIEAFEKQQRHQTKQLLHEIEGARQRERQLHNSLRELIAKSFRLGNDDDATINVSAIREPTTTDDDDDGGADNQTAESVSAVMTTDDKSLEAETSTLVVQARGARDKRDRERDVARQRLEELDLTNEQQMAIVDGQLRRCFEVLERHVGLIQSEVASALVALTAPAPAPDTTTDELTLDDAVKALDAHEEAATWLITVFSQMLSIEEAMVKRFQALLKAHSVETVTMVFGSSGTTSNATPSPERTTLWELAQAHKQRMVNLADPLCRTLRFSRQKQETIRKELVESIDETQKHVQHARSKLNDKEAKLVQLIHQEQRQQEAQQLQHQQSPSPPVLGSTGAEALMGSFGLRNAVASWTKQLSSPKKPLFKSRSASGASLAVAIGASSTSTSPCSAAIALSPRRKIIENDLVEARSLVRQLEAKEAAQRDETVKILQSTAATGVKTMELVATDYLKNAAKAVNFAATATSNCAQRLVDACAPKTNMGQVESFTNIPMFEHDDSRSDLAKLLASDENKTPETNASETESEEPEDVGPEGHNPTIEPRRSSSATVAELLEEMRPRAQSVVTVISKLSTKLQSGDAVDRVVSVVKRAAEIFSQVVSALVHGMSQSPDRWTCVATVVITLSLLNIIHSVNELDVGWRELAELQRENARGLQQVVDLVRTARTNTSF